MEGNCAITQSFNSEPNATKVHQSKEAVSGNVRLLKRNPIKV